MKRIDRYLIGKFLFNLAWALGAFLAIFLIVDLIEHLDKFIDKGVGAASIARYYYYYSPYIIVLIAPIAALLATLFGVGLLATNNELLAMRAAGLSLWRLSVPFLAMGLLVTGAILLVGETVYPKFEVERGEMKGRYIKGRSAQPEMIVRGLFATGDAGRVYYFQSFNTKQALGTDVTVQTFRDGRLLQTIEIGHLRYTNAGWTATEVELRTFSSDIDSVIAYEQVEALTFPDWKETPEDLLRKRLRPNEMRYGELREAIGRLRRTGNDASVEETELALKIAFPFINFIVVLIGFPIASRTRHSGMAFNFGVAMLITFAVRILYEIFRALGHNGELDPLLAAWAPNAIALIGGLLALIRVRK